MLFLWLMVLFQVVIVKLVVVFVVDDAVLGDDSEVGCCLCG